MAECKSVKLTKEDCGLKDWASFWEQESKVFLMLLGNLGLWFWLLRKGGTVYQVNNIGKVLQYSWIRSGEVQDICKEPGMSVMIGFKPPHDEYSFLLLT